MSSKKDPLLFAVGRAKLSGSRKTQYNHKAEAVRFVHALRSLGYGVRRWDNITNKHVASVVDYWRDRGLSTATTKEYLSGVRAVARAYGNDRIEPDNACFGLEARTYVNNRDKRVPQDAYEKAHHTLAAGDANQQRLALQLRLMRELGLRHEEARKFNPSRSLLTNGTLLISDGTKGGRDRILHSPSTSQLALVEEARAFVGRHGNTMPDDMRERTWEGYVYRQAHLHGLSRAGCGASLHGLRHAYTCERYEQIAGFPPPCTFESKEAFRMAAEEAAGNDWQARDRDARLLLKGELGHGPDRDDVVSIYLGSWK